MPFSFHFNESSDVFHIRAFRNVDEEQVNAFCQRLLHEPGFTSDVPILCDCSKLTAVSVSATLVESLAKGASSRKNLLAIIAPRAFVFGLARMYQIFSDPMDKRIHVFTDCKEALTWLDAELHKSAGAAHMPV
jgi:hypothetical protein